MRCQRRPLGSLQSTATTRRRRYYTRSRWVLPLRSITLAGSGIAQQDQPQTSCSMDGYMVHAPDCTEYMRGVGRNRCGGNGLARVMDRASVAVTPIQADIRASPVPLFGRRRTGGSSSAGLLYSATTGGASQREPLPVDRSAVACGGLPPDCHRPLTLLSF